MTQTLPAPVAAFPTHHAKTRAEERLKIDAKSLGQLMDAGVYSCARRAHPLTGIAGRLVWSSPDQACVLVWQNVNDGALVTCMLFDGTRLDTALREYRGDEHVDTLKSITKGKTKRWLLNLRRAAEGGEITPTDQEPPLVLHLGFAVGRRTYLPLAKVPLDFFKAHPVRSQRTARLFLHAVLASDWAPQVLHDFAVSKQLTLESLTFMTLQWLRGPGKYSQGITPETCALTCVLVDLADANRCRMAEPLVMSDAVEFRAFDFQTALANWARAG